MSQTVDLTKLPDDILRQLPLSIRSSATEYSYEDLPSPIRKLIDDYLRLDRSIEYRDSIFDIKPSLSEYGDLVIITDLKELILEYLRTYLMIYPGDYPCDPYFGCKLKEHLHTKDTNLRKRLISNEISNIVDTIANDLDEKISVKEIHIYETGVQAMLEYRIQILLEIRSELVKIEIPISVE